MASERDAVDHLAAARDPLLPPPPRELWDVACYGEPRVEPPAIVSEHSEPREPAQMPAAIQLAVVFECVAVALQGADVVLADHLRLGGWFELRLAGFVAVSCGVGVLMYLVASRRAWARIVVLNVVIGAGFVLLPAVITAIHARSPAALGAIALYLLHVVGAMLLFLPRDSDWFSSRGSA